MSGFPRVAAAACVLRAGGVIACPTEAVWGLSCDPNNADAVAHLLALKRRPVAKGLILVAATEGQIGYLLAGLTAQQRATLADSWPGPATWLLPHMGRVPAWVCGGHATVAVRVSGHPVVSALCSEWGGPLVSTSANRAGARPVREAFQVRRVFGTGLDYLLPGKVGVTERPTPIRDIMSGQIIRD
ncbi:MAG: Sua5/YciO/YrdC/YwlC family protein [Halioglobus sp.]|nr:Sua5/YciO/YrdC/YwlC family protein [Halioglobus sp.]